MDELLAIISNPIFWLKCFINPVKEQTKIFEELIKLFESKKFKTEFDDDYHTIVFYLRCNKIPEVLKPYIRQTFEDQIIDLETDYVTLLGYKCRVSLYNTISKSSLFSPENDGTAPKDYKGIQMDIDIVED